MTPELRASGSVKVVVKITVLFPCQAKKTPPTVTQTHDPFNDEQQQKQEMEILARMYEEKYVSPADHLIQIKIIIISHILCFILFVYFLCRVQDAGGSVRIGPRI